MKALTDEGDGVVEALVSTYDLDSVGDRVEPGAFAKTLAEWEESGDRIPVVWSHQHDDPFAHIGEVTEAAETDDGLLAKMQFDLENPTGRQAYRLVKGGRIRNYSFAYEVRNAPAQNDAGENLLTDLRVFEVGPTLIGANQNTRTISAKAEDTEPEQALEDEGVEDDQTVTIDLSALPEETRQMIRDLAAGQPGNEAVDQDEDTEDNTAKASRAIAGKAGRTLSAKNESELRDAHESIGRVLAQLDTQGKSAQPAAPANDEEPRGVKSQEPNQTGPDEALAAHHLITQQMEVASHGNSG